MAFWIDFPLWTYRYRTIVITKPSITSFAISRDYWLKQEIVTWQHWRKQFDDSRGRTMTQSRSNSSKPAIISEEQQTNTHTNTYTESSETLAEKEPELMVKKRVPDWLNNSMLSSPAPVVSPPSKSRSQSPPPPSSSHHDLLGSYTSKSSSVYSYNSSTVIQPPVPIPPPTFIRPEPPTKPARTPRTDFRDPLTRISDSDNDISSSVEDASRQTNLIQAVRPRLILYLQNQHHFLLLISRNCKIIEILSSIHSCKLSFAPKNDKEDCDTRSTY